METIQQIELKAGDWITITWGRIVQQHVVVGVSRHHVDTVRKDRYEWAIRQHGAWNRLMGFESWPKRPTGPRLSIYEMISHVDGKPVQK